MRVSRNKPPIILSGWKEIANYLGKGVRTVQRYERLLGLPVRRPAGQPWASVVATKGELDAWIAASPLRNGLHLVHLATVPAAHTWADIRNRVEEMRKLTQEMRELRAELKSSVRMLHGSIRGVHQRISQGRPIVNQWVNSSDEQAALRRSLFSLLHTDLGHRKTS